MLAALHRHAQLTVVLSLRVGNGTLSGEIVLPLDVGLVHQGTFKRRAKLHFVRSSLKPQRNWIRSPERVLLHRDLLLPLVRQLLDPHLLRFELIQRRGVQVLLVLGSLLEPEGVGRLVALLAFVLVLVVLVPSWMMEEGFGVLGVATVAINGGAVLLCRVHGNKTIKINMVRFKSIYCVNYSVLQ